MIHIYSRRTLLAKICGEKHFFSTLASSGSLLKLVDFINKNIGRVHGPTAHEVIQGIDLSNKTCLVTGANSGLGLEMSRCLASQNATVLMACRNAYAANFVSKQICENSQRVRHYEINLSSLKSVKKCSEEIIKNEKKIDIVLLNAGVFGLPWTLTEDMLETTFQVNFLSQFYMLLNIENILAPNVRVVFISSESHRNITIDLENQLKPTEEFVSLPMDEYTDIKAYNVSKLCGILAMHYLGYRWMHTNMSVVCAHPGSFVKTRLCRNWWPYEILYTLMLPFSKSITQAAATPIYCATSPELAGVTDQYYKGMRRCDESHLAQDRHLAFRIYDLACHLITDRVATVDEPLDVHSALTDEEAKPPVEENLEPNYTA